MNLDLGLVNGPILSYFPLLGSYSDSEDRGTLAYLGVCLTSRRGRAAWTTSKSSSVVASTGGSDVAGVESGLRLDGDICRSLSMSMSTNAYRCQFPLDLSGI